jgi:hypothetical protein
MRRLWQGLNGWRRLLQEVAAASRRAAGAGVGAAAGTHGKPEASAGGRLHTIRLGATEVSLRVRIGPIGAAATATGAAPPSAARPGLRYLNLHENEQTSVAAASALLQHQPGTLIELRAGGGRLVTFRAGWRPFAFDPNRIFTDAGLRATLRRHGSDTASARAAVQGLRDAVLALLAPATPATPDAPDLPVVALHNNGAGRYSVQAYAAGGAHARDAQAVAVNPALSPQDFFLVTRRGLFDALRELGFNVVLQSEHPADDGSLAVWFQQHGRAYVNVEALHGHVAEQQRMLAAVAEVVLPHA